MQDKLPRREPYKSLVKLDVAGTTTFAIVDSGNLVVNAMSATFAKRVLKTRHLEHHLTPLKCRIGTAQKGANMHLLGVMTKALPIRFGKGTHPYASRPLVFDGLNSEFNLAGPFLAQHQIDQIHSRGNLLVQGVAIPLVAPQKKKDPSPLDHISEVIEVEPEQGVYLRRGVEIPPQTGIWADCRVPHAQAEDLGVVEVDPGGELAPLLVSALVQVDQHRCQLPIMNTGNTTLRLNEGTRYGTWSKEVTPTSLIQALQMDPKPNKATKLTPDRKKWLLEAFKLAEAPWLKGDAKLLVAAEKLILEFHDIFSRNDEYGTTTMVEHAIHTEDVPPIRCKGRPLNPLQQDDLKKQLDKWLDQRVIEPSNSPWSFGLIAVPKKNGKTRWCLDFRPLNAITKKDSFPLPNMEDNLARMAKSKVFSALDGTGAYHVVPIREQDREKTAFSTPFGLFQFRQMPFGLCNAPATYSRLVQLVLADLDPKCVLPYLDDTCLHSQDGQQHIVLLRQFFDAHRRAGLMLQPEKCQLFQTQVEYLGHVVSERGVQPLPDYIQLVREWPEPKSVKDLRTFLGKVAYYRKFIAQFSHVAAPLYNLLSKEAVADPQELHLDDAARQAFQELREALTKAPILAYPDFHSSKPFILDTDWSHDPGAIGAVLSQEQDGEERVICYGARKLSKSERNYSSNKGELLAVIHFMRLWRYYLQPRPFILRTDHQALKWLQTMEQPAGMTQRWLETLGNNNFTVCFRRGSDHGNADSLSRVTHARAPTAKEEEEASDEMMYYIQALQHPETLDTAEVLTAQEEDQELGQVRRWVQARRRPTKEEIRGESTDVRQYAALFEVLHLGADQLLYRRPQVGEIFTQDRLCLPATLQERAIRVAHEDAGGHMGMLVTQHRLLHRYYFPRLHKTVEEYIRDCQSCQKKRPKPKDQRHTLVSVQEGSPFQKVAIDFVGPLQLSTNGNKYLLTVKDCFTRWIEAFPTPDMTASTVARVLQREIFSRFGLPEQVHSDQGTAFTSELMDELLRILGIKRTHTPAYNPKSNPVERSHQDLHRILRAMIDTVDADWEELLPEVLLGLRTARNRVTGVTPFYAVFGREAMLPIDYLYANSRASLGPRVQQNREFIQRLHQTYHFMRKNIRTTVERSRQLYSGKLQGDPLESGDLVWLFTPVIRDRTNAGVPKPTRKHSCFWTGPWRIQKRLTSVLFVIETHGQWNRRELVMTVSIDRLTRFRQHDQDSPPRDLRLRDLQTSDEFLEQGEADPEQLSSRRTVPSEEDADTTEALLDDTTAGSFPFIHAGGSSGTRRACSPSAEPSANLTGSSTCPVAPVTTTTVVPTPPETPRVPTPTTDATMGTPSRSPSPSSLGAETEATVDLDEERDELTPPGVPIDQDEEEDDPTYHPGGVTALPNNALRHDQDRAVSKAITLRPRGQLTRPRRYEDYQTPVWWRKKITLPRHRPRSARLTLPPPPTTRGPPTSMRWSTTPARLQLRPPVLAAPSSSSGPTQGTLMNPSTTSPWDDRSLLAPSAPPLTDDDEDMSDCKEEPKSRIYPELLTEELQDEVDKAAQSSKILKSTSGQDVTRHRTQARQHRREAEETRRRRKHIEEKGN